jgi:hypothetical protein
MSIGWPHTHVVCCRPGFVVSGPARWQRLNQLELTARAKLWPKAPPRAVSQENHHEDHRNCCALCGLGDGSDPCGVRGYTPRGIAEQRQHCRVRTCARPVRCTRSQRSAQQVRDNLKSCRKLGAGPHPRARGPPRPEMGASTRPFRGDRSSWRSGRQQSLDPRGRLLHWQSARGAARRRC